MHLPRTCQLSDIKGAVAEARCYASFEPIVIAVMHHDDFKEDGKNSARLNLSQFPGLLTWIGAQPDLSFHTPGELAGTDTHQANMRIVSWKSYSTKLPWRIKKYFPRQCLVDAPFWRICLVG